MKRKKTKKAHRKLPKSARLRKSGSEKAVPAATIRFQDDDIVIVDKPSGLTTVRHTHEVKEFGERARKYLPPTLADLLPQLLGGSKSSRHSPCAGRRADGTRSVPATLSRLPGKGKAQKPGRIRAVHRLDKDTSGVLVFARTPQAERHLGKQMRAKTIGRKYLALVRGKAKTERIESYLVEDRGDGRRGSTQKKDNGKRAVTHVRLVEELGDYSLVECTLETGRTHQVRIHLGERGTPLCGERIYDRPLHGKPLPDGSGAKRPLLHANYLEFDHPVTGKRIATSSPLPDDMKDVLQRLRRQAKKNRSKF